MPLRIAFVASRAPVAQTARAALIGRYGDAEMDMADVIVALGGDGFMLQTLHGTQALDVPVYGMNCGTIGFLMNEYGEDDLHCDQNLCHWDSGQLHIRHKKRWDSPDFSAMSGQPAQCTQHHHRGQPTAQDQRANIAVSFPDGCDDAVFDCRKGGFKPQGNQRQAKANNRRKTQPKLAAKQRWDRGTCKGFDFGGGQKPRFMGVNW